MKLQEWANENEPDDKMIYKSRYWDQISFIRENIPSIFCNDYKEYQIIQNNIRVISNHTSKSIKLPVVHIVTPNNTILILRYNFYDWKVSVKSLNNITGDFTKLFDPDNKINPSYCEGFKNEWVYGSYNENQSEFTVEIDPGEYYIFTFLWIMARNYES